MRETTIRHLLVFVLCASGVVALWILADRSLSAPDAASSATPETTSQSGPRAASPIGGETPGSSRDPQRTVPTGTSGPAGGSGDTGRPQTGRPETGTPGRSGTPNARQSAPDQPPAAVRGIRVIDNNHDSITVRWNADSGKTPIAYYQVTLNGIPVGETAGLQLTINWFNDDMTSHFIRIRAVDVDGRRGQRGDPLIVDRPARPSPTPPPTRPSPTSSPTPTPRPPHPKPTPTPSPPPSQPTPTTTSPTPAGPTTSPTGPTTGPTDGPTNDPTGPTTDPTNDPSTDPSRGPNGPMSPTGSPPAIVGDPSYSAQPTDSPSGDH